MAETTLQEKNLKTNGAQKRHSKRGSDSRFRRDSDYSMAEYDELIKMYETTLGEISEHRFRAGEEVLRIYELNPRLSTDAGGREIKLTVRPSDVVLLPFDAAHA